MRLITGKKKKMFLYLTASSESSKFGKGLFARASNSNKQCVAPIDADDAVNPGQMFQSIIKQD